MKKKLIALIMIIAISFSAVFAVTNAFATDVDWRYDSQSRTLYIFGSGNMDDYDSPYSTPWSTYLIQLENIVIESGVTSVGNNAFAGASSLSDVSLAESVVKLGTGSFSSCQSLTELTLSENVISIGDISFSKIGADNKPVFTLYVQAGSYPLFYAVKNGVTFACDSVKSGKYTVHIPASTGMKAYYPYTAALNGTFSFYSESKYDTRGYVYDSNMSLISINDDYSTKYSDNMDTCDFGISVQLEKGKTYYFVADIINPTLRADFDVFIAPSDYYVSGTLYAMNSPLGDMTDTVLTGAKINGTQTDGTYSLHITEMDYTAAIECDGSVYYYVFSPDNGDTVDIPVMLCDMNGDRLVNAKDYAIMLKNNYSYIDFFETFINYKY